MDVPQFLEEAVEAVSQQVVYAGFPRAINGLKVLQQVFEERDAEGLSP